MEIQEHTRQDKEAWDYVSWCLSSGQTLSQRALEATRNMRGALTAFSPAPLGERADPRFGGYGSVKQCERRIADLCSKFLAVPGHVVAFEHHLVRPSDPHGYLVPFVRILEEAVVQMSLSNKTTLCDLESQILDWSAVPIFNAFLADIGKAQLENITSGPENSPLNAAPILDNLKAIVIGGFDGEGFLFWRLEE